MTITVIGGSASGKSKIAEEMLCALSQGSQRYYVATMLIGNDEENIRRVAKHRAERKEKEFITIECPRDIEKSIHEMEGSRNILLECVSNLTANEMFSEEGIKSAEETVRKVREGIRALAESADQLVIVSNNIFESGMEYDAYTRSYLEALGRINRELADISDEVYEAVAGIKVRIK